LGDRLDALGESPRLPQALASSAAEEILGPLAQSLADEFDDEWRKSVTRWWQDRHQYAIDSRRKIALYDVQAAQAPLSVEDAWNHARLTEEFVNEEAALQMYRAVLQRAAAHAGAGFALGRLLLSRDDASGIEHLEAACNHDPSALQPACELIVAFFNRSGRDAEARPYVDRYFQAADAQREARRERGYAALTDTFVPHQLEPPAVSELAARLLKFNLRRAYFVRKETLHYPNEPLFVLGVQRRTQWWRFESSGAAQALINRISRDTQFAGETLIISLDGEYRPFRSKFRGVADSLILSAK
jgi:hypothetical protein